MKKLFFTAIAVLAFSGSGFAEGKVYKKPQNFSPRCRKAGNAAYDALNAAGTMTCDEIMGVVLRVIIACNGGGAPSGGGE